VHLQQTPINVPVRVVVDGAARIDICLLDGEILQTSYTTSPKTMEALKLGRNKKLVLYFFWAISKGNAIATSIQ